MKKSKIAATSTAEKQSSHAVQKWHVLLSKVTRYLDTYASWDKGVVPTKLPASCPEGKSNANISMSVQNWNFSEATYRAICDKSGFRGEKGKKAKMDKLLGVAYSPLLRPTDLIYLCLVEHIWVVMGYVRIVID